MTSKDEMPDKQEILLAVECFNEMAANRFLFIPIQNRDNIKRILKAALDKSCAEISPHVPDDVADIRDAIAWAEKQIESIKGEANIGTRVILLETQLMLETLIRAASTPRRDGG